MRCTLSNARRWLAPILFLLASFMASFASAADAGIPPLEVIREAVTTSADAAAVAPARASLERIDRITAEIAALRDTARQADGRVNKLRREGAAIEPLPLPGASLATMEQALDGAQQRLTETQGRLSQIESDLIELTQQPARAREDIARLEIEVATITQTWATQNPALPLSPPHLVLAARYHALEAEIDLRQTELQTHGMRLALLNAERDTLRNVQRSSQARVDLLIQRLGRSRTQTADRTAAQTLRTIERAGSQHPVINTLAAENAALAEELTGLARGLDQVSRDNENILRQLTDVETLYRSAQTQIEIAGVGQALSRVLHEQRKRLPDLQVYRQQARARSEQIAETRLRQFQIDEKRRDLDDTREAARNLVIAEDPDLPLDSRATDRLLAEAELLLDSQKDLLERLSQNYLTLIDRLTQLDVGQKKLTQVGADYTRLLDENLLWIASDLPIKSAWFIQIVDELRALGEPDRWRRVGMSLLEETAERPLGIAMACLILLAALWGRPRLRRHIERTGIAVNDPAQDRFALTVSAIAASFVLAAPLPLLAGLAGWMLQHQTATDRFVWGLGDGLVHAAWIGWVIESFRRLGSRDGVLAAHFHWQAHTRELLYRNLRWLVLLTAVATVLMRLAAAGPRGLSTPVLGRAVYILFSVALVVFIARVFHPGRGVLGGWLQTHREGWAWRGRNIGYALLLVAAIVLAIMPAFGYSYTAIHLQARAFFTGWLLAAAALVISLLMRGLSVSLRRIEIARAGSQIVETMRATVETAPAGTATGAATTAARRDATMDVQTMNAQVRALLNLALGVMVVGGLYLIWGDTFSALKVLNRITLWSTSQTGADGATAVVQAITLGSLGLALVALALTLGAARNVPGLLEVLVLQRQGVDAGTRYAATLLSRYTIFLVGLLVVVNELGIDWSKAQWLVAALSVGLGFGLQEIVANFVSGIILLFERPIRIGDTVTVGGVSGNVTRIRIRATTIQDWDRKEMIVPNKSVITDAIINWTLSDLVARVVVPVGIAYGADPSRALAVMEATIADHPLILKDPAPAAVFTGFGDSALNFELRVFVKTLADSVPVRHQLHLELERRLREAGIEIPFPQRDVHLRSVSDEVVERLKGAEPERH